MKKLVINRKDLKNNLKIIRKMLNSDGKDDYGNSTYTTYSERYACQEPTGRDNYGNPTYN